MNSYEIFGKVITAVWFLVGLGVAALVLLRAKRTPRRVALSAALAISAIWLLSNSSLERWLWLRCWPKSRMQRIHAEACEIMWQVPRFAAMTPNELEPELAQAMTEFFRRIDAEMLLEHARFMAAVAALHDSRLCDALGKADPHSLAVMWDGVERISEQDYDGLKKAMLAATRSRARDQPMYDANPEEGRKVLFRYLELLGPKGQPLMPWALGKGAAQIGRCEEITLFYGNLNLLSPEEAQTMVLGIKALTAGP